MPQRIPTSADIRNRIVMRIAGQSAALTDLTPISGVRMYTESAIVEELAALWAALSEDHEQWFVGTATRERLERRLADYGIVREAARAAYGDVSIAVSAVSSVPPGALVFTTAGGNPATQYAVARNDSPSVAYGDLGDGTWRIPANGSRLVRVIALVPGAAGNAAAATIVGATGIQNVTEVSNPSAFVNGRNIESDTELRERFRDFWELLRGGTRGAIIAAARGFVAVDAASGQTRRASSVALEEWNGSSLLQDAAGTSVALRVFVDEGAGVGETGTATASTELVQSLQRHLDGEDTEDAPGILDAGVPAVVVAALAVGVRVAVGIDADPAFSASTVEAAVREAVVSHFARLGVAGLGALGDRTGQLHAPRLFRDIVNVPGVLRATLSNPVSDVDVPTGYRAVVGKKQDGSLDLAVVARVAA